MLNVKSHKELESIKLVKEKSPPIMVKDQKYLNNVINTGFAWNNKHRANDKYYPFYHKYHDKALPNIEKLKLEEKQDKKVLERMRIQQLAETRAETLNRFQDRAQERKLIQTKSRQTQQEFTADELDRMISPYEKTIEKKAKAAKHSVHTDNKWNFLLEQDQKRAQLYVTPTSVKGEESLICHVQKKIQEEMELEALREKALEENRQEILKKISKRHTSISERFHDKEAPQTLNLDLGESEKRFKANETPSGKFIAASSLNTFRSNLLNSAPRSLGTIPEDVPDSSKTHSLNPIKPKKKIFTPKNALDRHEFRGLLIKHCNEGISEEVNPMVSALTSHSQFFSRINSASKSIRKFDSQLNSTNGASNTQSLANMTSYTKHEAAKSYNDLPKESFYGLENLLPSSVRELQRESRQLPTKPKSQVARSYNDLDDYRNSIDELDEFDKKYVKPIKYTGYPRSDLEVANYQNETKFRNKLPSVASQKA